MATVESSATYTPEDLLAMPDGDRFELVDGHLVERPMGAISSLVGAEILRLVGNYNREHRLGHVFGADGGFQCFPDDPGRVRKPDVSFLRRGRLPREEVPDGYVGIAPDLAVEVLSPNDQHYETSGKIEEYLSVGVRLIWVVDPVSRTVLISRADRTIQGLRDSDELSGEDVLPGFRCRVAEVFEPMRAEADGAN
ncbi:MAG TPA: Uma2 family endonuclease [Isosphaeraceae bacterium]|jgi:Uma2 family endonuclease|nr:Uma2 family endonuclease [Isosphaeraceae bacterium]